MPELTELLRLGPFTGIDASTADPFENPEYADSAPNVDPTRYPGALATARGRVQIGAINSTNPNEFVYYMCPFTVPSGTQGSYKRFVLAMIPFGGTNRTVAYDVDAGTQSVISGAFTFTSATQIGSVLYTNGGQQFRYSSGTISVYPWVAFNTFVSTGAAPTVITTGGNLAVGTYTYAYTTVTTYPDGSTQESPVLPATPTSIVMATVTTNNSSISVPDPVHNWSGTNSDGSTYTTNLYRASTAQPIYYLVANVTGSSPYLDTQADATIAANQQIFYRDYAPNMTNTGYPNFGPVFSHQERTWIFVNVNNALTLGQTQPQLWYSDYGVPWSFHANTQVELVGNSEPNDLPNPSGFYFSTVGDIPCAGVSLSSVAVIFKRRAFYLLEGNDVDSYILFKVRDIGCAAPFSVTVCEGAVCWISDQGAYMYDGGTAQYIGEPIRDLTFVYPYLPGDISGAVGWYSNRTWFVSFPSDINVTFAYHIPTGKWRQIPYTTNAVVSIPSETTPLGSPNIFNEIIAAGSNVDIPDADNLYAWEAAETDLGNPITATWVSPIGDSGRVQNEKVYRAVAVAGPVQVGVTATITLSVYGRSATPWTQTFTFDMSEGASQVQNINGTQGQGQRGYYAQVTVALTNAANATVPAQLYSVVIGGEPGKGWTLRT